MDILYNARIHGETYDKLNDPMEGYFKGENLTQEEWNQIREERKQLRICSLAGNHTNNLMWTHYADEHRGCCIAVEVPERCKWQRFGVSYVTQPPVISTGLLTSDVLLRICSTKADFWQYEQEVRFVKKVSSKQQSPYLPVRIREIFLGVRVSEGHERLIRRIVDQFNLKNKQRIEVVKMRRENVCFYTDW
jgi:hypothetical protein